MAAKKCSKCGSVRPLEFFSRGKDTAAGYKSRCKDCVNAAYRASHPAPQPIYVGDTKRCPRCGEFKGFVDFPKHRRSKNGIGSACKKCKAIELYQSRPITSKTCGHCGELKHASEFYVTPNGVRHSHCRVCDSKKSVAWQRANRTRYRARIAAWTKRNLEKARAYYRAQYYKNKDRYRVNVLNRIARKRAAQGKHTLLELRNLLAKQRGKCAACRTDITKNRHADHIIPLASGGSNDISNIQLLCPTCNMSKGKKNNEEFLRLKGFINGSSNGSS